MSSIDDARRLTAAAHHIAVSNPEWHRIVKDLLAEIDRLAKSDRRLSDMLPLFQEARDALPAIKLTAAELRGIRLDLADRMDAVGVPETWLAMDAERQKAKG